MPPNPEYLTWLNAEHNAGRLTRPDVAIGKLRGDPSSFLQNNPLSNTWDRPATANTNAYLINRGDGQRPGSVLKTARMHTTESFTLQGALGASGDGCAFLAFGV